MIESIGFDTSMVEAARFENNIEAGFVSDLESIDFSYNIESGFFGNQAPVNNSSITGSALDYMVSSKNSLIDKSTAIQQSFLGDTEFTFKDKMVLLEKTYSYQLEMTYYNTFMSQAMQKTDSLIQLK